MVEAKNQIYRLDKSVLLKIIIYTLKSQEN